MLKKMILGRLFGRSVDCGLIDPAKISSLRKGSDFKVLMIVDGQHQYVAAKDAGEQDLFYRQIEKFAQSK